MNLKRKEYIGYLFLVVILSISLYLSISDKMYFNGVFAAEDGFIEWGTTILLGCSSIYLWFVFLKEYKNKRIYWFLGVVGLAILFLFAAGEEISWGQRLFDLKSGDFFNQNNKQKETNLHNLMVGDVSVNKHIFGKLIILILTIYLLIFPFLYKKSLWIKDKINLFAIPLPRYHHTLAFVIATLTIVIIQADRKWEVYEFCFALIFFLIFINPKNYRIYRE
ncbi:hypothetical protein [Aquimarina latercula]|uniref:hypothetical protein n=1 Tax=Aquimarina latercula TaxID=987 RepID=UPI00041576BB|nr:hypothetical protein [Aquimarina latercula]